MMRYVALGLFWALSLNAAQSPMEPNGPQEAPDQPGMCSPKGDVEWVPGLGWRTINSHECHCKRMHADPKDCDSEPTLDSKCTRYCKENKCTCPVECDMHHEGGR